MKEELDKFGYVIGSAKARVNALLTAKPKSMRKLMEEGGFGVETFYHHMNEMVRKGHVIKTKKREYRLKK